MNDPAALSLHLCVSTVLLFASAVPAEEPFGLSLLDPNSLAGWEHSAEPARGWTIENGILRGTKDSTPLLSGWTFGNFELRFRYSVSDEGQLKLSFLPVPNGRLLELGLMRSEIAFGTTDKHETRRWISKVPDLAQQRQYLVVVRRDGTTFTLRIDGHPVPCPELPKNDRVGLTIGIEKGTAEISDLRVQEFATGDDPAGTPLFNGQDLSGWWTPGNKDAWAAKDGAIALVGGGGNYLRSDKEYGNFTLSLEYKIRKKGNSGIGIRTARNGWPSGDGMEMQIEDSRKLDASATMAIYRNVEPIALAEKSEDWNQAVIKADGRMVSAWLNGVLVQQVNTQFLPELRHRPLKGWIGFQDHGAPIQFRNIHIIEAPDGMGLDAWYAPRNEPASRLVLDRLMNPERLTLQDGSVSGAVSASVSESGEHVLANLTGLGALVRITRSKDAGQLGFYFDGEEKPRIECPAGQLNQHVPQICGDSNPVLTFLGYEKSLKVVLRDASQADYRLEYVTLPPNMPVETFRDKEKSIARGMLPAIDYRHFQMSYGTYRDFDPLPRADSGNVSLAPGARANLISLEGAGMVKWLRLRCDPKMLADDNLWLEVTVDGEKQPALATPARFLFPGLEQGKNYHNFLVFNKGGFANVLPMPFGHGLTIAAVNRGEKELKGVGVAISYAREKDSPDQPSSNRLRLRGVFQQDRGDDSSDQLLSFTGRGRWIGLVCETPQKSPAMTIQIDGQTQPAANNIPLELLAGLSPNQEQTHCLSGRSKSLTWCFHLLAPSEFQRSFAMRSSSPTPGKRLALFYAQ